MWTSLVRCVIPTVQALLNSDAVIRLDVELHNNSPGDVLPGQKKGGQPQPVPRFVFYTVNVYASIVSYKVFAYKHK